MHVRSGAARDIKDCVKLARMEELKAPDGGSASAGYFKEFLRSPYFLVAEHNGKVIGFAVAEKSKGLALFVDMIGVDKRWRGMGAGKLMIMELEARAKKHGLYSMHLFAPDYNKATIAFYKKRGFLISKKKYRYVMKALKA